MKDLKLAEQRLKEKNFNLLIVKDGETIFATKSQGIRGLLQAIEKIGKQLRGSSVADRIVGRAAALLCAYFKASSVFAVTLSEEGEKMLKENEISYRFENRVPNILNYKRTDICPFEKHVMKLTKPEEAYEKLKSFIDSQN
ncbi:hypothetical protein DRO69_01235 [Candidatus Bathyarchaeota archaeon]|nr:MAG: hypothetical protein DRO69_01235 [Candidatus Bathyarchaeota archaeon]